jgi:hypothetical protein
MRVQQVFKGDTLTCIPLQKRDRFPPIIKLQVMDGSTWAITAGENIALGQIPEGYMLQHIDKYEVVFKTGSPSKSMRKKKKYQ